MAATMLTSRRPPLFWALLLSVSLLLAFNWYHIDSPQPHTVIVSTYSSYLDASPQQDTAIVSTQKATADPGPPETCLEGVVTVLSGGRLGNLVLEYASAAAVARRHHLRLAVPSAIYKPLSAIFKNLTAEPLSKLLQQPACRGLHSKENKVLNDKRNKPRESLTIEEKVKWAQSRHKPLILSRYIILIHYFASSMESVRQEFHFKEKIQNSVDKKLDDIVSKTAQKTGCNKTQVCTVGVHVRRTDYGPYMRRTFHLKQEAGLAYYNAAAAAMLADLHSDCAAVAFAVTSDDSKWCQQHLLPALTRNASEGSPASKGFLLSSKTPANDLCLLSSCQHLIMAYGTFGLTAAILSGGRTIMYDTDKHGAHPLPAAQLMTSLVPHWRLVS